jgi:DNA-binding transcriptional LysR family regulator
VAGADANARLTSAPGVAFRPVEEPTPLVGYGIVWNRDNPSQALESFLDVARGFADATVPTALN